MEIDRLKRATDVNFVPMDAVGENGGLDLSTIRAREDIGSGYTLFFEDDVLVAKITPCFENGKGAIAKNLVGGVGYGTTELYVLDPAPNLEPRFLFYLTISRGFREAGEASMKGAAGQKRVPDEFIQNFEIALPPLDIQRFIANYLDRETARIDALVAEKERMLALLEEKRAALISRAVARGLNPDTPLKSSGLEWLGDIPAHWVVCQLKRTWASADYGLSESIRDEGSITVLRMSCIIDGTIDITKAGTIAEADEYLLLRRNDLLFNRTNSLDQIAKIGIVDFDPDSPLTFASYLVRIRVNDRATPKFLSYLLNSLEFLDYARKNAIPAIGQANLSPTRYGEIHIPLPPVAEQDSIVHFLDKESQLSTPIKDTIRLSITLLKERRAALITATVAGQIPIEEMTT